MTVFTLRKWFRMRGINLGKWFRILGINLGKWLGKIPSHPT